MAKLWTPPKLTRTQWLTLRMLARTGQLSVGPAVIDKIRQGLLRFTEETSMEVHRVTAGEVQCWVTRPDLWAVGMIPPALSRAS